MITSTTQKVVAVTPPGAIVDNAAFTTASIDTKGFDYCTIYALFGAMDIAMAALKVGESDTDSGYVTVSGLDYSVDGTLPSATADNTIYAFDIDLRGRKRYLDVTATGGDGTTGTYCAIWAVLSRASETPATVTQRGLAATLSA